MIFIESDFWVWSLLRWSQQYLSNWSQQQTSPAVLKKEKYISWRCNIQINTKTLSVYLVHV